MRTSTRNDTVIQVGTFLARRWSGNPRVTLEFSRSGETRTRLADARITLPSTDRMQGDDFERYRQLRAVLWYESMRFRFCEKIFSNDHAFGFVLNAIETRRIELLGRRDWRGMDGEIAFNYIHQWDYRPPLDSVYGKARIVEGFYQLFLFGQIKGEIAANQSKRITQAARLAGTVLDEAVRDGHGTIWIEKKIPEIIKILDVDSLFTIPISLPWMRRDVPVTRKESRMAMLKISRYGGAEYKVDPGSAMRGSDIGDEYRMLVEKQDRAFEPIGVRIPPRTDIDETAICDLDLISRLKTKFKDWKSGWSEERLPTGDEFDAEAHIEGLEPFFADMKKTVRTRIVILLDHSSSIASNETGYKKATHALCEVLAYLKIGFAVYAFSTVNKEVVCWLIKSDAQGWNNVCAKRLAQISANGSTPLGEVYEKMHKILQSKKPDIFLSLTDGEPSDPDAVRSMIRSLRAMGIGMVALGLGSDTLRATAIASNLRGLGYERTLAVGRLADIPGRVLGVIRG